MLTPLPTADHALEGFPTLLKERLGLFPIPLYDQGAAQATQFVLYNGARGNFCLDLEGSIGMNMNHARSVAWSANVGHYVSVLQGTSGPYIEIQRWDQQEIRRYSFSSVVRELDKFYRHLEDKAPTSDRSVVTHVTHCFRVLRRMLGPECNGFDALRAFLLLIASASDNNSREEVDLHQWRLDTGALEVVAGIEENEWNDLIRQLVRGQLSSGLEARINLILRHAAGQVFQEAHYIAAFTDPEQLHLPGFTPRPVGVNPPTRDDGLHFTPPALARSLVEEALLARDTERQHITVFDPACGSGEFLREALRQLRLSGFDGQVDLIGWDVSSAAIDMTKFVVGWEMRGDHDVSLNTEVIDSLSEDEWPVCDIVIMNPPFGSWNQMTEEQRESVSSILTDRRRGKADLAHAFLFKAAGSVRERGVVAAVIPASVLDSKSAQKLRSFMSQTLGPTLVARLGSHYLFPGVTVDTALVVANRGSRSLTPLAFWADHRPSSNAAALRELRRVRHSPTNDDLLRVKDGYSIYPDHELGLGGKWTPRPYQARAISAVLEETPTVGDIFNVRQGSHTGRNSAFIINKDYLEELPEGERAYFRRAIVNESIRNGIIIDKYYVFYPYGICDLDTEEELSQAVPTYYGSKLLPVKEKLETRGDVRDDQWWKYSKHRSWQVEPSSRLVTAYFGRAGAFTWDARGEYVVIQGYAWIPKSRKRISSSSFQAFVAILNSPLFEELLSAHASLMAGGQWNLSKRYIEKVPLPNIIGDYANPNLIARLSNIGKTIISEGLSAVDISDKEYYSTVASAYGLNV